MSRTLVASSSFWKFHICNHQSLGFVHFASKNIVLLDLSHILSQRSINEVTLSSISLHLLYLKIKMI